MIRTGWTRISGGALAPLLVLPCILWATTCHAAPLARGQSTEPRCAFVVSNPSATAGLTEAKLLESGRGTWLERNEIDRILAEQELAACFAAESPGSRIALGRLLKADLLVLVRSSEKRIDLVVAETTGGLRILAHSIPESADSEADAAQLVDLVSKAMAKYGETIQGVYAVPPFLSRDLGTDNNHLMAAYAALVERVLLAQPGMLVIETAEAEAISHELALTAPADGLKRPLPIYLWGEYRHDGHGDSRRISFRLETKRGSTVLRSSSHTMPPDGAPGYLERAAVDLLGQQSDATVALDAETEARELVRRSGEFLLLRDWQQALTLAELSLLLAPDEIDGRTAALLALRRLNDPHRFPANQSETLRLRRRTFHHITQALNADDDRISSSTIAAAMFWRVPRNATAEIKRQSDVESDYAMRMAYRYAERRVWDKSRVLLFSATMNLPDHRQVDEKLAFLSKYRRVMDTATRIWVIESSLAMPKAEKTRLWSTVLSWEDVDEDLRARILMRQRRREEGATGEKQRVAREDEWKTMPVTTPAASSALTFRALDVRVEREDKALTPMPVHRRCLSLDDGSDVFWSLGSILVCHVTSAERGTFLRTYFVDDKVRYSLSDLTSDGRYLWLVSRTSHQRHRLNVIDPQTGQTWSITKEHGLPLETAPTEAGSQAGIPRLHVAPLGYGEAIVAGYHGDAWIAHVRFDPDGQHRVNVFHEAQEVHVHGPDLPVSAEHDDSFWNTHIAFEPRAMATWAYPDSDERRVIIARDVPDTPCQAFWNHPLLVNPDDFTVSVMNHCWRPRRLFDSELMRSQVHMDWSQDQLNLIRFCHPEQPPRLLASGILDGQVVVDGDTVHVVGREWQRGSLKDGTWLSLGETPWNYGLVSNEHAGILKNREFGLISAFRSNIFGIVVVVVGQRTPKAPYFMAQVLFDGSGGSLEELSSRW